jgi:hypothetical protein
LSSDGRRVPEGQAGGVRGVQDDQITDGGLVDLGGLTLRDLRDLRDADDESCLARALSRILAPTEVDGHHGFQSNI